MTGSVYYITGCNQYLITAKPKDKNTYPENQWVDEDRLKLISKPKERIKNTTKGPGVMAPIK